MITISCLSLCRALNVTLIFFFRGVLSKFVEAFSIPTPTQELQRVCARSITRILMSILIISEVFPFCTAILVVCYSLFSVFFLAFPSFPRFTSALAPSLRCNCRHGHLAYGFAICELLLARQLTILCPVVHILIWPVFLCSPFWSNANFRWSAVDIW